MEPKIINNITKRIRGRTLFLIGMMGSGKSKTGPELAKNLGYKFIDLDSLVEEVAKKSIDNIFLEDGETTFRDIESKCLQEAIRIPSLVVSTGGGVIKNSFNWGILRQGIIIWLDLRKDIALKRLKAEIKNRPLLRGKNLNKLYSDILYERENLYAKADFKIEISNESVEEVVEKIIYVLEKVVLD